MVTLWIWYLVHAQVWLRASKGRELKLFRPLFGSWPYIRPSINKIGSTTIAGCIYYQLWLFRYQYFNNNEPEANNNHIQHIWLYNQIFNRDNTILPLLQLQIRNMQGCLKNERWHPDIIAAPLYLPLCECRSSMTWMQKSNTINAGIQCCNQGLYAIWKH